MNSIATLTYTKSELIKGVKQIVETYQKSVFCEVNSLSFESRANLQNNGFKASVKCVINRQHDNKELTSVEIDGIEYRVISVDRFKASDTITLLLSEVL